MIHNFENPVLQLPELPRVADVQFKRLHPSYKMMSLITTGLWLGILGFVLLIVGYLSDLIDTFSILGLYFLGWFILFVFALIIKHVGYGKKGYAIREHDILYRSGIWWRREICLPKRRIQHVEIRRGPLDDVFDLSRVNVYTAGDAQSDLTIPGLQPDLAERLKENLLQALEAHDREEE